MKTESLNNFKIILYFLKKIQNLKSILKTRNEDETFAKLESKRNISFDNDEDENDVECQGDSRSFLWNATSSENEI